MKILDTAARDVVKKRYSPRGNRLRLNSSNSSETKTEDFTIELHLRSLTRNQVDYLFTIVEKGMPLCLRRETIPDGDQIKLVQNVESIIEFTGHGASFQLHDFPSSLCYDIVPMVSPMPWCQVKRCRRVSECRECGLCSNYCPHSCLKGYWQGGTFRVCRAAAFCTTCHKCEDQCGCSDVTAARRGGAAPGQLLADASFINGEADYTTKYRPDSQYLSTVRCGRRPGYRASGGSKCAKLEITYGGRRTQDSPETAGQGECGRLSVTEGGVSQTVTAVSDLYSAPWFSVKVKHLGDLARRRRHLIQQLLSMLTDGAVSLVPNARPGSVLLGFDAPIPLTIDCEVPGAVRVRFRDLRHTWCARVEQLSRECPIEDLVEYILVPEDGWAYPDSIRPRTEPSRSVIRRISERSAYAVVHYDVCSLMDVGDMPALLVYALDVKPTTHVVMCTDTLTRARRRGTVSVTAGVEPGTWLVDDPVGLPGGAGYHVIGPKALSERMEARTMSIPGPVARIQVAKTLFRARALALNDGTLNLGKLADVSQITIVDALAILSDHRLNCAPGGRTGCYTRLAGATAGSMWHGVTFPGLEIDKLVKLGVLYLSQNGRHYTSGFTGQGVQVSGSHALASDSPSGHLPPSSTVLNGDVVGNGRWK